VSLQSAVVWSRGLQSLSICWIVLLRLLLLLTKIQFAIYASTGDKMGRKLFDRIAINIDGKGQFQILTSRSMRHNFVQKQIISRSSTDLNPGSCKGGHVLVRWRGWILWRLLWRGITSVRCVHSPPFQVGLCARLSLSQGQQYGKQSL